MNREKLEEKYFALENVVYKRIAERQMKVKSQNAKCSEELAKIRQEIIKKADDLL